MKKKALASLLLALLLVFSSLPLFQAQAQTLPMKQELYQTVADDLRLWPIFPGDGDPGGAYPYTTTPKGTVFFVQEFKRYNNLLYGKTKPRYQYGDLQEYHEPLWINLAYSKNNQWVFEGSVPHQHNTNGMPATSFERFQKIPADRDEHEVMKVTTLRCTCRYLSNRMTYEHEAFEPHEWEGQRCASCGYVAPEFAVLEIVRDPEQLTVGDYGSWTVNTNDPDHAKKYKFAVYREEEVIYDAPPRSSNILAYPFTEIGLYYIWVEITRENPASIIKVRSQPIRVNPRKADMSLVKWDYDPDNPPCFNYQPHKVQVVETPPGLTVNGYSYQEATMPGSHRTIAYFDYDPMVYEKPDNAFLYWDIVGPKGPDLAIDRTANGMMIRMLGEGFATSYALFRSDDGSPDFMPVYSGQDNSFEDTHVEYGKIYHYRAISMVKYENVDHPGPYGPERTITVLDKPERPKAELSADRTQVNLTWQAVRGAQFYLVKGRISTGGGMFKEEYYQCTELNKLVPVELGKFHYFSVIPCTDKQFKKRGVPSDEAGVLPMAVPTKPQVKALSTDSLQITMPEMPGATRYDLWFCEAEDGVYRVAYTGEDKVFVHKDLAANTSYFYRYGYFIDDPIEGLMTSEDGPVASGKTKAVMRGDANNDLEVDIQDLISLINYLVKDTPCPSMKNADANQDSKVDHQDAVAIINMMVGD